VVTPSILFEYKRNACWVNGTLGGATLRPSHVHLEGDHVTGVSITKAPALGASVPSFVPEVTWPRSLKFHVLDRLEKLSLFLSAPLLIPCFS
jgi:hypothetical protein